MKTEPIIIVSEEADEYVERIAASGLNVDAVAAHSVEEAQRRYTGQRVVLGEPDLVADALPSMDEVRWVQSTWAGVKPLLGAAREGLHVTGIKEVFGPQMAEYVIGYLLTLELGVFERRSRQERGEWYDAFTGTLHGKTLGVMGTGSIGSHIARVAQAFGMRAVGYSRSGRAVEPFEQVYGGESLHPFLGGLDYLVAVLPATPETDGLLDAEAFASVPDHCVLVNVGRGNVVDEMALVAALEGGSLAGAVLDVFRAEPLPAGHPFWTAPNLLVTAHVAARSWPADIVAVFLDNYRRFIAGQPLRFAVDAELGY